MQDCTPNFWSMAMPSAGKYYVLIQAGHPCEPSEEQRQYDLQVIIKACRLKFVEMLTTYYLHLSQVNGVSFMEHQMLSKGQFYTVSMLLCNTVYMHSHS
jgi:hypothetical protein